MIVTFLGISVHSSRLGNHLHGVAGTLLETGRAARALRIVEPIASIRPELDDRVFGTRCVAVVTFVTIAAGEASLRLVARPRLREARDDLLETAYPVDCGPGLLRARVGIAVDGQMKHLECHKRVLHGLLIALAAQPRIDMPRRVFTVADRDRDRPLARNHVPAGEDPRMARHHVRPHLYDTILGEFDTGHLPEKSAIRLLPNGQYDCIGLERLESPCWLRSPVGIKLHHFDRKLWADNLLDGSQPLDLDPLLKRFVRLEGTRRHVGTIAPIDDERLLGPHAPGCARRVHRSVPPAVDDDPAAKAWLLTRIYVVQKRNCIEYASRVADRDINMLANARTNRNEDCVKVSRRLFRQDILDSVVDDDSNAHVFDALNLLHQNPAGQAVGRNAEMHHAARKRSGLVNLHRVSQTRQMVGGG